LTAFPLAGAFAPFPLLTTLALAATAFLAGFDYFFPAYILT
jgi:hypothetical protein